MNNRASTTQHFERPALYQGEGAVAGPHQFTDVKLPELSSAFVASVRDHLSFKQCVNQLITLGEAVSRPDHGGILRLHLPSFQRVKYSRVDCSEAQTQKYEDLLLLNLRAERLRLRCTIQIMRGIYPEFHYHAREESEPKHPIQRAWEESSAEYYRTNNPENKREKLRECIGHLNRLIPENHHITYSPLMNRFDFDLLSDLYHSLSYSQTSDINTRTKWEDLTTKLRTMQRALTNHSTARPLEGFEKQIIDFDSTLRESWVAYRQFVKDFVHLSESPSWSSPTYSSSGKGQRGPLQESKPFTSDYQRWQLPEGVQAARDIHRNFFRETDYREYAQSHLFPSGMVASSTVFSLVRKQITTQVERQSKKTTPIVLAMKDIYFEIDSAIDDVFDDKKTQLKKFAPREAEKLVSDIRTKYPDAVIVAPIGNSFELEPFPMHSLFSLITDAGWVQSASKKYKTNNLREERCLHIIIDNSLLGDYAQWKGIDFRALPKFVRIYSIESLLKYGQDGLDLIPAGMVTTIGGEYDNSLERFARRSGVSITEVTARRLAIAADHELLQYKLKRHSENSQLFREYLQPFAGENNFIKRIINPLFDTHPSYQIAIRECLGTPPMVHLELNYAALGWAPFDAFSFDPERSPSDSPERYQEKITDQTAKLFNQTVIRLAHEVGLDLNGGTSYGFNTTRIASYNYLRTVGSKPNTREIMTPYIRIAIGTESRYEMALLAQVIGTASRIFERVNTKYGLLGLPDAIAEHSSASNINR